LGCARKSAFAKQTLREYLNKKNKTWFQSVADGEAGFVFISGIFNTDKGCWVAIVGSQRMEKILEGVIGGSRIETPSWWQE
jgi:hypothetical protein